MGVVLMAEENLRGVRRGIGRVDEGGVKGEGREEGGEVRGGRSGGSIRIYWIGSVAGGRGGGGVFCHEMNAVNAVIS